MSVGTSLEFEIGARGLVGMADQCGVAERQCTASEYRELLREYRKCLERARGEISAGVLEPNDPRGPYFIDLVEPLLQAAEMLVKSVKHGEYSHLHFDDLSQVDLCIQVLGDALKTASVPRRAVGLRAMLPSRELWAQLVEMLGRPKQSSEPSGAKMAKGDKAAILKKLFPK